MAFPVGWTKYVKITIDHNKVIGGVDLSNFPVLVTEANLTSRFWAGVKSDGSDIRFSSDLAGTTELCFQVVAIDTAGKTGDFWVKIPTVSASVDTVFYIWYGNAAATAYLATDTFGSRNVWTNGYRFMYHLKDDTDATANAYTLTETGGQSFAAAKIGNGKNFTGGRAQNNSVPNFAGTDVFAIGAWVKLTTHTATRTIHSKQDGSTRNFELSVLSTGKIFFSNAVAGADLTGNAALSDGTWYFVVGIHSTASSGSNRIMINGVSDNNNTATGNNGTPTSNYTLGANSNADAGASPMDGIIDEAFMLTREPTQGEVTTMYNNQNAPATFMSSWEIPMGGSFLLNFI